MNHHQEDTIDEEAQPMKLLLFLFKPNALARSPRAQRELSLIECVRAVDRHLFGDWGLVSEEEEHENNTNLKVGSGCLLSIFKSYAGELFWVITEGSWQQTSRPDLQVGVV